jgi:hypothetical protein
MSRMWKKPIWSFRWPDAYFETMSKNKVNSRTLLNLCFFLACFISSGVISIFLGQDCNWDLKNYHFYNAYAFLNDRLTYDIAPAQIQSFHNPLLDVPFYLMMRRVPPVVYGFVVGGVQGINIWLVYRLAYLVLTGMSERRRLVLSLATGITGYLGAANLSEIGTIFQDNITSIFILAALLAIFSSIDRDTNTSEGPSRGAVIASGVLIGWATGLKLTNAIYALPFIIAFAVIQDSWKTRISKAFLSGLSICAGFIVTMGYWMMVLWEHFESPIFPYFNALFRSPYYELSNFIDARFFPRDKYQTLFYPFYFIKEQHFVSEVGFRDIRLAVCYLLLMLVAFVIFYRGVLAAHGRVEVRQEIRDQKKVRQMALFTGVFFIPSYVLWLKMFSIYRYIVPLELLSPVLIIIILRYIFPFEKVLLRISLTTLTLIILTTAPLHWGRLPWGESFFDVRIPNIKNLAQATVVMAGYDPLSYVIPYFPAGTRFVRIQSNFVSSRNLVQDPVSRILSYGVSNVYFLWKEKSDLTSNDYVKTLSMYGLRPILTESRKVHTRFDDDLFLVPLRKIE